jgi:serine phosphatase RsbU (regulator of sigma subunit)
MVDDQPANLLALEAVLTGLQVNLVRAESGFDALRQVLSADFAMILLDVQMPGMDGFEAAKLIRSRKRSQDTPILFLTGIETAEPQLLRGYELGAVDYLVKPIVPIVLRTKVSVFLEICRKAEQIKRQAKQLQDLAAREHERQLAEVREAWEHDRLMHEMRAARQTQRKLFPTKFVPFAAVDIAGESFMADATGGDYFDCIPTPDGGLAVVVGDVSGHGMGPALLVSGLRAYLRAFLHTQNDIGQAITLVNRSMAADSDQFATLLAAKIDPDSRSLLYTGAGHLPGFIIDASGATVARLESEFLPLAVLPDTTYTAQSARKLQPGDVLVLFTDGIIEAHNAADEMFGMDRVLATARHNRLHDAQTILDAIFAAVNGFCGPKSQLDDMTAVVIKAR